MFGEDVIRIDGTVVEVLPNALFRVALPNGHRVLTHVRVRERNEFATLAPGDRVAVEMTPYDFSRGRLAKRQQ